MFLAVGIVICKKCDTFWHILFEITKLLFIFAAQHLVCKHHEREETRHQD